MILASTDTFKRQHPGHLNVFRHPVDFVHLLQPKKTTLIHLFGKDWMSTELIPLTRHLRAKLLKGHFLPQIQVTQTHKLVKTSYDQLSSDRHLLHLTFKSALTHQLPCCSWGLSTLRIKANFFTPLALAALIWLHYFHISSCWLTSGNAQQHCHTFFSSFIELSDHLYQFHKLRNIAFTIQLQMLTCRPATSLVLTVLKGPASTSPSAVSAASSLNYVDVCCTLESKNHDQ